MVLVDAAWVLGGLTQPTFQEDKNTLNSELFYSVSSIIVGAFLALAFAAALILTTLVDPLSRFGENERKEKKEKKTGFKLLIATFRHMLKKKQLLIIPITFWSGIVQGIFSADFTAVSFHVQFISNTNTYIQVS